MANTGTHSAFPSRPYTSGFGRSAAGAAGGSGAAAGQSAFQTPFGGGAGASSNPAGGFGGAGSSSAAAAAQQQREAQRLERERVERAERERREAEEREVLEQLSEEQREEVNEAFSLFDLDKDSYIDYHELKVALKALGFDLPKADILNELQTHGLPASTLAAGNTGSGGKQPAPAQITFSGPSRLLLSHAAFLQLAAGLIAARDPREEISRAFDLFDVEGKGRIELGDLRRVARELGEGLQEEELQAMIDEFDIRGEGGIGREEFMGICMGS